jgi:hypothetical protein
MADLDLMICGIKYQALPELKYKSYFETTVPRSLQFIGQMVIVQDLLVTTVPP